ncbi:MAG: HmuY family protein, partial [Planctomycetaceae bacterium]
MTALGRILCTTVVLTFALAACSDGEATAPVEPETPTLTVDASADWAYVRLAETASVVSVAEPGTSDGWDVAFFATSVMLNGGAAGPAGVEGTCVCQNASATDAAVVAMTPE